MSSQRAAVAHLRRVDPVLARVIARVGPCRLAPGRSGRHFDYVVRAIVYQQLAGAAAATIHGRLLALFGGRSPGPEQILATPEARLRAVGLSRQKLGYLRDLAARAGDLPFARLGKMSDEDVIVDLGVRTAFARLYPGADIEETAEAWRPYRSIASWYLWRSLEER